MNIPQPKSSRRFSQFGLSTLLLAMIPLGALFLGIRNYLDNRPIEWTPYSARSLDQELNSGKTALVSYTANWSLNLAYVERTAIETPRVQQFIRSHGIIPMRADWTEPSQEIHNALQTIGVRSIPAIAIYSPSSPDNPIVLTDLVTEQQVLDALESARARSLKK